MKKLKHQFPDFAVVREKAVSEKDALAAKRQASLGALMAEIFNG